MITNTVYAHLPYPLIKVHLDAIIGARINTEIYFSSDALNSAVPGELAPLAELLAANELKTTFHAPFIDLNPGSLEPLVRQATLHRFNQLFDVAEVIRPSVIVFHPGYDRWRYGETWQKWLDNSIDFWQKLLVRAERIGCTIAVENIFEEEPSTLRLLFEAIDSPLFRHCFDVGHWNLFAKVSLDDWFAQVGGYIAEAHLHDNNGIRDDHLPLGEGGIDFYALFALLKRHAPEAAYTLEAHSREGLERAHKNLSVYLR
ncbi:MAG: sugar phosphate isomerase/epimerase family protein [Deltaproteobacteria bacterium]